MKPIRIFTHADCEPPGHIATLLDRRGYPYEQVCLHEGARVPGELDTVSALVFMGGPGNVKQPTGWMREEIALIARAREAGLPMLGICLGGQLMSLALGGDVRPGDGVEVGWHAVELLDGARSQPAFAQAPARFEVFQWHAHVFTAPPGARILATSSCTECQAYAHGNSLAVQFHLEMTEPVIRDLIERYGSDLRGDSACNHDAEAILHHVGRRSRRINALAETIYGAWFDALAGQPASSGMTTSTRSPPSAASENERMPP